MMIRTLLLLIAATLMAPLAAAQTRDRDAELPRLRPAVTVVRDVVRIGDLIDNAGAVSDVAIFRSPDPGSTGSISSERVLEIARAHNLLLVDSAGINDVEVTRVSRAIGRSEIEQRIVRIFASQFSPGGDPGRFAVTFEREPRTLHVEPQAKGELQVARANYDQRSTRFDVTLTVPGAAGTFARYTGTLVETMPAVILARPIGRGETIRASDVTLERRPKSEVTSDTVTSIEEIAGMAARSPLRAGPPLRRADLVKPEVVKRDEAVTLIYEVPGITLTVRGKAIESGAEGDLINVVNSQSKRTVQGVVTGPGRVTIASPMPVTVAEAAETAAPARQSE